MVEDTRKFESFEIAEQFRTAKYGARSFTDMLGDWVRLADEAAFNDQYESWYKVLTQLLNNIAGFIPSRDLDELMSYYKELRRSYFTYISGQQKVRSKLMQGFQTDFPMRLWDFDREVKMRMARYNLLIQREGTAGQAASR